MYITYPFDSNSTRVTHDYRMYISKNETLLANGSIPLPEKKEKNNNVDPKHEINVVMSDQ